MTLWAVVTKYHDLESLSNINVFSHSSGNKKAEIEVPARLLPSGGWEEESGPCLSVSFWWFPEILGVPWLLDTSLQSLPPQSQGSLPTACLSVSVSPFFLL